MNITLIAFFAMSIGVVGGFFVASLMAVAHINDLHVECERKKIVREKEHLAEVESLKRMIK